MHIVKMSVDALDLANYARSTFSPLFVSFPGILSITAKHAIHSTVDGAKSTTKPRSTAESHVDDI